MWISAEDRGSESHDRKSKDGQWCISQTCAQGCRKAPKALTLKGRQKVLDIMHAERFVDMASREITETRLSGLVSK